MKTNRRSALRAGLTALLLGLAAYGMRRGVPGAGRLATRLAPPRPDQAETKLYGYKEVKLS